MAGHRDDGSFADDDRHHPNRRVNRERFMSEAPYSYSEEWVTPDYDEAEGPPASQVYPRRPLVDEFPEDSFYVPDKNKRKDK